MKRTIFSNYLELQILYHVKIVTPATNKVLLNECMITSIPSGYSISKDENDVQVGNFVEDNIILNL